MSSALDYKVAEAALFSVHCMTGFDPMLSNPALVPEDLADAAKPVLLQLKSSEGKSLITSTSIPSSVSEGRQISTLRRVAETVPKAGEVILRGSAGEMPMTPTEVAQLHEDYRFAMGFAVATDPPDVNGRCVVLLEGPPSVSEDPETFGVPEEEAIRLREGLDRAPHKE